MRHNTIPVGLLVAQIDLLYAIRYGILAVVKLASTPHTFTRLNTGVAMRRELRLEGSETHSRHRWVRILWAGDIGRRRINEWHKGIKGVYEAKASDCRRKIRALKHWP